MYVAKKRAQYASELRVAPGVTNRPPLTFIDATGCERLCNVSGSGVSKCDPFLDPIHYAGGGVWHDDSCSIHCSWRSLEYPFQMPPKHVTSLNVTGVDAMVVGQSFWPRECIFTLKDPPRFHYKSALRSIYGDEWHADVDPRGLISGAIGRVHMLSYLAATVNSNVRSEDEDYPQDMISRHYDVAIQSCTNCEPWDPALVYRCCDRAVPQHRPPLPHGDLLMLGVDNSQASDEDYSELLGHTICQNAARYRFNCDHHAGERGPRVDEEWWNALWLIRMFRMFHRDPASLVYEYLGRDILAALVEPVFSYTCDVHTSILSLQDRSGFFGLDATHRAECLANARTHLNRFCVSHVIRAEALSVEIRALSTIADADIMTMTTPLAPEMQRCGNHKLFRWMQRDHFARRHAWSRFAVLVNSPRAYARSRVQYIDNRRLLARENRAPFGIILSCVAADAIMAYIDSDKAYLRVEKKDQRRAHEWLPLTRYYNAFNFFGHRLLVDSCVRPPPIRPGWCSTDCLGASYDHTTDEFIKQVWARRDLHPSFHSAFMCAPAEMWSLVVKSRNEDGRSRVHPSDARDKFPLKPESEDTEPDEFRTDSD